MEKLKKVVAAVFDFLQGIVVIMAILVMVYLFIMSPQEINGASMEPNFYNGEYILTNKVSYKIGLPTRGDVVIFKSPRNKDIDYIKRVIGLPGDEVELRDSTFFVNGLEVEEPYIPEGTYTYGGSYLQEDSSIVVPEGMYFVVGDNRQHSSDSREFGPIPLEDFIGQAFLRYFPFDRAGVLPHPRYDI